MSFRGFSTTSLPRGLAPPTPEPSGDSQRPSFSGPCPLTGTPNIHPERILQDSQLPLSWLPIAWASLPPGAALRRLPPAPPQPVLYQQPRHSPTAALRCCPAAAPTALRTAAQNWGPDAGLPPRSPRTSVPTRVPSLCTPRPRVPMSGSTSAPSRHKVSSQASLCPVPPAPITHIHCFSAHLGNVTLILHTRKPGSSYRCLPGICASRGPAGGLSRACPRGAG